MTLLYPQVSVSAFQVNKEEFDVEHTYEVRKSDVTIISCVLQEEAIIKDLYTYPLPTMWILLLWHLLKCGDWQLQNFFLQSIEVARKGWWTMPRSFEHTDSYRRVFHQLCIVIKCCQKLQNCIKGYESLGLKRHLISVYRDPRSYRKMFFKIPGETVFLRCSSVTYCELRKTALANYNICGLANGFVNV